VTTREELERVATHLSAAADALVRADEEAVKDSLLIATQETRIENLEAELEACLNPEPPTGPLIGVNQGGVADFMRMGGPIQVVRVFDQGNWEAEVRVHLDAGRTVILSVKSDANQARAAALFSDEGVWLARVHEPDAKGMRKEAWRQEQLKLAPLNGAFNLLPITTAAGFVEWVTAALLDDVPYHGTGFDAYLRAVPWNSRGFDVNMKPCLEHAATLNLPALVCEFGVATSVDGKASDPVMQAAEVAKALDYSGGFDVAAYCYFNESVTKDVNRDYRLDTRPLALAELQEAAA
jgi:hypothetical protein